MRLFRVEVWNWRGLDHVLLADLAPDLNLVVGPNESGKSRLFEALRFGLFERHKGESEEKKKLRSWGSSESPEVEVHFEAQGQTFTLRKRFLKGARARLEGGGRTWVDDDAEAELRRLWGTREITKKKDVEQFLGLWPLLWVEQGKAGSPPHQAMNEDARGRLRDSLSAEVSEVAAGPRGQRILARAEAERDRYWTASTWRETGELQRARTRHGEAEAALAQETARRDRAREAADELLGVDEQLGTFAAKVDAQRRVVTEARDRERAARERAAALEKVTLEVKALQAKRELAGAEQAKRAELAAEEAKLRATMHTQGEALALLEAKHATLADEELSARRAAEQAERAEEAARAVHAQATLQERRADAERWVVRARAELAEAKALLLRVGQLEQQIAALRVTAPKMKALRQAQEAHVQTSAKLSAAAARVRLRALHDLTFDGTKLRPGEEKALELDEPTTLVIDGVAEIHVWPAGGELQKLRDQDRDARQLLGARLEALGVTSVAMGEEHLARRIELEAERAQRAEALANKAPGGPDRLEQTLAAAEAELGALGTLGAGGPTVRETEEELARIEDARKRARAARDHAGAELVKVSEETAVRRHAVTEARTRHATAVAKLESLPPADALGRAAAEVEAAWAQAESLRRAEEDALRRRGDLDAALDREREERALSQLERTQREAKDRRIALDERVRHAGGEGIHEAVQEAERAVAESAAELLRTEGRAAAARTLIVALVEARREIQERLVLPVRAKIEPYLGALLPGAQLDMDEDWRVVGLRAKNQEEAFDALSSGAQEQVGLLVRLGLAEVLGQKESLPLVLDDCLVNTDADRQTEMLRILYRASRRQQILLFSCHDVAFDRLGATRRYDLPARRAR